ncbi:MAG TPA: hypothetical protein VJ935_00810 [Acidimicrobiia bacterium]|nr:hypothetical protein [Acidimicrobiia bacterium]
MSDQESQTPIQFMLLLHQYRGFENAVFDVLTSIGPLIERLDSREQLSAEFAESLPPAARESFLQSVDDQDEDSTEELDIASALRELQELMEPMPLELQARVAPGLIRLVNRAPRSVMVYESLVVMAVANFEGLFASLLREYHRSLPDTLNEGEHKFTIGRLRSFATIEDALEEAIEERVDMILAGDLDDWHKWLERHKVTNLHSLAMSDAVFRETFQRRHVIVHNRSQISKRYASKTHLDDPTAIGRRLSTGPEYVRACLDELKVVAVLLAASFWRKVEPNDSARIAAILLQESFELLQSKRWAAVVQIAKAARDLKNVSEYISLASRANAWFARAKIDGWDSIKDEVRVWDTSGLKPIFQVVKGVLLLDNDAAFQALPAALSAKELDEENLRSWPILAPLRDDPRFPALYPDVIDSS